MRLLQIIVPMPMPIISNGDAAPVDDASVIVIAGCSIIAFLVGIAVGIVIGATLIK